MKLQNKIYKITVAALLCAIGILIPTFSPLKIVIPPASFTLASHVAIFIAMFISPMTSIFVTIGTTVGFFFGGFPTVVVARAASHIIFVVIGSIFLAKREYKTLESHKSSFLFALVISIIHGLGEVAVVMPFYFNDQMTSQYYESGFLISVVLLVGIGTIVHSMVDFYISYFIWKPLKKTMPRKLA